MKYLVISLSLAFLLVSCKTLKTKSSNNPLVIETIALNKVVMAHENVSFSKKTLEAKIDVQYDDGSTKQDVDIRLRLEKDKTIWMSGTFLGFPVAKIMITPTRIQYYEKINKTYFDGDFSLLKEVFGIEMNFSQIQNLLLGQAFFSLKDSVSESLTENNAYLINPKKQNPKFDIFYIIDPQHFKLISQEAKIPNEDYFLVSYPEYYATNGQLVPKKIIIDSKQSIQKTKIFMDIRSLDFDKTLNFPFEIPLGYSKLDFTDLKK